MPADVASSFAPTRGAKPSFGRCRVHPGVALGLLALAACSTGSNKPGSTTAAPEPSSFALKVSAVDTRFHTRDHFMASLEMQLSGEPFAEAMGRDLGGYARDYACQDS